MKETIKDNEFKIDLKSIPWETNILSQVILSASSAFDLFFKQINTLLDEHARFFFYNTDLYFANKHLHKYS